MRVVRDAVLICALICVGSTQVWGQIEEEELGETSLPEVQPPSERPSIPEPLLVSEVAVPEVDRTQELEDIAEQKYLEGDLDGASKVYQELATIVENDGERINYLVSAAWLNAQQSQVETATGILTRALEIDSDFDFQAQNYAQEFVELYYQARQGVLANKQNRARSLVRSAITALGNEQLERARTLLQEALSFAPDNAIALYNLGLVDSRAGQTDAAISRFERLIALDAARPGTLPTGLRARTLSSLGLLYYNKGFLEDARTHFEQATRLAPESAGPWNNLGLTLRQLNRSTEATAAFERAVRLAPEDPRIVSNLASSLISAERWMEAVSLLLDVTERNPVDGLSWLNLALAQRGLGNLEGARESLARVVALDSDNRHGFSSQASTYLAVIEHGAGRMPEAIAAANRAVNLDPANTDAWVYLGLAQLAGDDGSGALQSFENALDLAPTNSAIHNNVGTAQMKVKDYEGAKASFRQALAIKKDFHEAQANLEEAERRLSAPPAPVVAETKRSRASKRNSKRPPPPRKLPKPIGVEFDPIPYTFAGETGALIARVQATGPGARGGLRKGDIVMSVDGKRIESGQAIIQYLYREAVNEDAIFDILRDGKPKRVRVRIF